MQPYTPVKKRIIFRKYKSTKMSWLFELLLQFILFAVFILWFVLPELLLFELLCGFSIQILFSFGFFIINLIVYNLLALENSLLLLLLAMLCLFDIASFFVPIGSSFTAIVLVENLSIVFFVLHCCSYQSFWLN